MSNNDEETFWVLEENDAFIARKMSGRNFRFKKRKGKGKSGNKKGSHQQGGFKPFRKSGSGGKANMANENYDPYDQAYWGKGKGKKGKKGKTKFQYPYDGNKGYPPYENGKGKGGHDKGKSKTFAAIAEKTEEQPAIQQTAPSTEPTYAGWTDQDWDQSWTWNEQGWHSSHETSSTGQALMAFHDAYEHHEKEAIHGKLIQADAVAEHNLSVTTNHSLLATKLMAPVINPQHNPTYAILDNGCTRSMGSWHAIQRFTQAIEPMKDIISYQYIPAETKFTSANGETARVNWTLHLQYHTTPPCSTNIDVLEQGTVPILSISQMRNLYMTIEHTPQCDKITCKAFGMNRQAVPVSGTGHALVDLAGVARVKAHGEIAHKGLTNYVYDDDNSIQFPSGDISKSETVCAAKSSETKEDLATPKIIGPQKQDHWILDKKNKQLSRVHITPRKALFTPNGAKECPINPGNISRERTTEIIDASGGGDPDILEDNWRLTSQANKPMINLWIGKTIFTFADNSLKDEEAGSEIGSSTRRAGRPLSQILSHHPQKNQQRFRLH